MHYFILLFLQDGIDLHVAHDLLLTKPRDSISSYFLCVLVNKSGFISSLFSKSSNAYGQHKDGTFSRTLDLPDIFDLLFSPEPGYFPKVATS